MQKLTKLETAHLSCRPSVHFSKSGRPYCACILDYPRLGYWQSDELSRLLSIRCETRATISALSSLTVIAFRPDIDIDLGPPFTHKRTAGRDGKASICALFTERRLSVNPVSQIRYQISKAVIHHTGVTTLPKTSQPSTRLTGDPK